MNAEKSIALQNALLRFSLCSRDLRFMRFSDEPLRFISFPVPVRMRAEPYYYAYNIK